MCKMDTCNKKSSNTITINTYNKRHEQQLPSCTAHKCVQ